MTVILSPARCCASMAAQWRIEEGYRKLDAIDKTENHRLQTLLGKGYFPKELPPVFTTEDFGSNIGAILVAWEHAGLFKISKPNSRTVPGSGKYKKNSYTYKIKEKEIETISMPKRGFERRNIHVAHPIPQSLLSFEICKN